MDTGSDFIKPEFLNILFFQQKNLVIFPYVDLKHLHSLEIYTAGYNIIDLESTALNNLKKIIEFESNNSYSQNPTLFFIYNVDRENVKELMELDGIHCIINSNENLTDLANGNKFIFFNKKNIRFLNYDLGDSNLEFENFLISTSQDEEILQEKIHQIKIAASKIFRELNQDNRLEHLPDILVDYNKKYWDSILQFTSHYYDVHIPNISSFKFKQKKKLKDFSDEYEVLLSTNKPIGKEFIQLLHEYRSKKVNPQHLELDELYNPLKLYNYLRNHHWKNGIPNDFIEEWTCMGISRYQLSEPDKKDFKIILKKIGMSLDSPELSNIIPIPSKEHLIKDNTNKFPSLKKEWESFKQFIFNYLEEIEHFSDILLKKELTTKEADNYQLLFREISELADLVKSDNNIGIKKVNTENANQHHIKKIKDDIIIRFKQISLESWVQLYDIKNRFQFIVRFITQFEIFHDKFYGKDDKKDMPLKIKDFHFPLNLEKKLLSFNKFRNIITHKDMEVSQISRELEKHEKRLNNIYFQFLAYLIKTQIETVIENNNLITIVDINSKIYNFVVERYLKPDIFSIFDVQIIQEMLY